jgi:glycosyltransferase involved in cell wall biosynthesis
MRICHIIEAAGGGSGQVVINLARYGLSQGDKVTVVYAPERAEPKFVAGLQALENIKLLTSPMQRAVGLHDISDSWSLFRTLRKAGPFDVIHGHSSKAGALSRLVGPFLPGTVVYTPHAFYSMMPGTSAVYGYIELGLSWLCSCVIAVSLGEFHHGKKLGIEETKLFLIPNGTTPQFTASREEARRRMGVDETRILFGFVGRMAPQKNPLRLIAAFARVVKTFPTAHLVMVGDGQLRAKAQGERDRLNLQSNIDFLGHYDARAVIPGFDCLICSSDFETLPISFLECLSAGVPIVTTPVGGIEEAIVEDKTGFASRDFSTESLAEAILQYLACSPEQRQQMSANALEHSKLYTAEIMGEKYTNMYQMLIAENN